MNNEKVKKYLEEIVHCNLYISNELSLELKEKWQEILKYFKNNNDIIDDLKFILSGRTNDNSYVYDKYIKELLCSTNDDFKLLLLNNSEQYQEILKNEDIYIELFNVLVDNKKINYLIKKSKFSDIDYKIINYFLNNGDHFGNVLMKEILKDDVREKIESYSIDIVSTNSSFNKIDISDYEICSIFTKKCYTNLLLKKCKNFSDFLDVYNKENKILNLINNNSLIFNGKDNEKIYGFIKSNPNFVGKFDTKYLDLFNVIEIKEFLDDKTIDNDSYSTIVSKMFQYDNSTANELFKPSSLKKCSKHGITIYPFDHMDNELRNTIFDDYLLFNKFIDVAMIEAINKYFMEEDILNILRTDSFVEEMSEYAIELLLNKLSFKSAFNMLQRKGILDKINNLNVKISDRDVIFIKGFLDSPILVYKSDHSLINEMLHYLTNDDVCYYLELPYIINALSIYEIITISLDKKININTIINNKLIMDKFNISDLIDYIDRYWDHSLDLSIFNNRDIVKKLFNITDDLLNKINFDEVNYLYETIRMKSVLSKQDIKCDVTSYKSVLISYFVLGLDMTLNLVNIGNSRITMKELRKRQKDIVNEKIIKYKDNNLLVFQGIHEKVLHELDTFKRVNDKSIFISALKNNTYLNNIVFLMVDSKFDMYNNIINRLNSYVEYSSNDKSYAKKDICDYLDEFVNKFIDNKIEQYNNEFDNTILSNFKLKEKIVYRRRKELGKEFVLDNQLKIFVRALTEPDINKYAIYFLDSKELTDIKEKYIKYLRNSSHDFDNILEHILIPLINKRFDIENCLNKLGYIKPSNYDKYVKYKKDLSDVMKINIKLNSYKDEYIKEEMIDIMNYICYGMEIDYPITSKALKKLEDMRNIILGMDAEVYVDKTADKIIYSNKTDFYNMDELVEYENCIAIINKIIDKTYKYTSKLINGELIVNNYAQQYYDYINNDNYVYPITDEYYELKKRVLSLNDIKLMYNGYELTNITKTDKSLLKFIDNYVFYYLDGYYNGLLDNFGVIISSWDKIKSYGKNDLSIVDLDNILKKINYEKNTFANLIDKKILDDIVDNSYYQVETFDEKLRLLVDIYKDSLKRISSTIPYISYEDDIYQVKIIDNYSTDALTVLQNSFYRVGAVGNDLLAYSLVNKNGCQIGIYENNVLIDKAIAIRNGNVLYINILEGQENNQVVRLLKSFSNLLIKSMENEKEPIQLVTIVNNDLYSDSNGCVVDTTICPIISYPINEKFEDYKLFKSSNYLIGKRRNMYTNYDDNYVTLLANNVIIDKDNFKSYDPDSRYLRKRNDVVKLSNNIEEIYRRKIELILTLSKCEDYVSLEKCIDLNNVDTIYLGDDFVIFYNKDNRATVYQLPYDKRSNLEVDTILKTTR